MMGDYNSTNTLGLFVSTYVLNAISSGTLKRYDVELNEDTYDQLIETSDGNIIFMSDEVPEEGTGCYFYNEGEFPYMLRRWVEFIMFTDGERQVPMRIKYTKTKALMRMSFDSNDEAVEDPDGQYCVWQITYGIGPVENQE